MPGSLRVTAAAELDAVELVLSADGEHVELLLSPTAALALAGALMKSVAQITLAGEDQA